MFRFPSREVWVASQRRVVTVTCTIAVLDPTEQDNSGNLHQILTVRVDQVLSDDTETGIAAGDEVNLAIRYGDPESMPKPIPNLAEGEPMIIRGAYISAKDAYTNPGEVARAVIHFTHRPIGWVEYHGVRYD